MWGCAPRGGGGGLVAIFRGVFASAGGAFVFARGEAGHSAIIPWGLDTFLIFPNFLRS